MIRVILRGPGDQTHQIDTPDPALIGAWLKAIFDKFATGYKGRPGPLPSQFTLEVWG